jgi:hypothetical protein
MFKQKNILVSEDKNILWPTETKSIIIKPIKQSKLGNPVFIIPDYALKHSSPQSGPTPGQPGFEVSRGQDWYQNYHAYRSHKRLQSYTFRLYSTIIKPLKNKKLTKEIQLRLKNNK